MLNLDEFQTVPPYTNRGAENTRVADLSACVDWLSVTFKAVKNPKNIIMLLGLDESLFIPFETGKYGYAYHLRFGHIAVYYSPEKESTFLDISGQGCREFEQNGKYPWSTLLALILMNDVNITRLDLAIDDKKGYFTFAKLKKKIIAAEVRSRFSKARVLEEFRLADGENLGTTIYFGSPASMIQVRIYDKYKQILNKKAKDKEHRKSLADQMDFKSWIRTEMQLRDDRAYLAARLIADNEGFGDNRLAVQILGHLRNYILFVDNNGDKNKSRWPVSPWWEKFLNDVEKLPLSMKMPDATIEKARDWLFHSVTANLDTVLAAFDYNLDLLLDFLVTGALKRKKKHENMLKAYFGNEYNEFELMDKRNELLNKLIQIKIDQAQNEPDPEN
jgi:phage replication initiation protein